MNHAFFNTTQKVSVNPCTERAPVHQGKRKHSRANPNLKQWCFFFNIWGIVHMDWVPEGQTVNQVYNKEVLTNLHEQVRRRRPEVWKKSSWVLHQDNAPAHNALSVKTFLTKHNITMFEHPLYSPDLAPCDFFYFQRLSLREKEPGSSLYLQWRQKWQSSWINYQKTMCSIVSNSGRFTWSSVGIREGSTMRLTAFLLCNFLNKKCSKHQFCHLTLNLLEFTFYQCLLNTTQNHLINTAK